MMQDDHMDIGGGMVPILEGKYFLEKATGRVYKVDTDSGQLEEITAPEDPRDLDNWDDDDKE